MLPCLLAGGRAPRGNNLPNAAGDSPTRRESTHGERWCRGFPPRGRDFPGILPSFPKLALRVDEWEKEAIEDQMRDDHRYRILNKDSWMNEIIRAIKGMPLDHLDKNAKKRVIAERRKILLGSTILI